MSNFVTCSTKDLQPFRVIKNANDDKNVAIKKTYVLSRNGGTRTINVGVLESIHMLRELIQWTLIVH